MRILLAASAAYDPPQGGSTRSNLVWLRALAALGHEVRVLCGGGEDRQTRRDEIEIEAVEGLPRLAERLGAAIAEFGPDFVLVSSEDLSHSLLRAAYQAAPDRLVYLAHTPQWFPFGPEAWNPEPAVAALLNDALSIVAIGEHMARYIAEHLGREAVVIPPALYGREPWPEYENQQRRSALLINACTAKGLPIVLELARRHGDVRFLALKGWGTTPQDEAALRALPNVEVLDTVASIDEVFARTAVLLAPSLWYEGFGLVVTEALLRGIPVLAAQHGGLTEAAAASEFRLPVAPIRKWLPQYDATGMPEAVVEPQPVEVWSEALTRLLGDAELYARERANGMRAARDFARGLKAEALAEHLAELRPRALRVYLIHNSTYFPGQGGGDKSNRLLMEALAARGHRVRVFTRLEGFGPAAAAAHQRSLEQRGIAWRPWSDAGHRYELGGVEVHTVTREHSLAEMFAVDVREFRPDVIVSSTDDPAHVLLEAALEAGLSRVVYLVRAPIALPFGPAASSRSESRTERLKQVNAVVTVSEYVARYCREYGGLEATHVPIALPDEAAPALVGRADNEFVTMINPGDVKGIAIFLALADAFPQQAFAYVAGWNTTAQDRAALAQRANIVELPRVDDISEILRRTRVLIVPSLWAEAWGRVVQESLARGVPVLAANTGGLPEAMRGVPYVLPVREIAHYQSRLSEQLAPVAEVPEQDAGPWITALREVLASPERWAELSQRGRAAAQAYAATANVAAFEGILRQVMRQAKPSVTKAAPALSPVKRRLLARRLEQYARARRQRCFPVEWGEGPRVFLFPWAEAGVQAWSFVREFGGVRWVPAMLAGREDRHAEPLPATFRDWVVELAAGVAARVEDGERFVLAGHSMGGGLAFEVARELRRRKVKGLEGVVVSSCAAPRGRVSGEAALGDRALFAAHVYASDAPLEAPLVALSGQEEIAMDRWQEETSGPYVRAIYPGGHFWLLQQPEQFARHCGRLLGID